jgi:hypothetical protein
MESAVMKLPLAVRESMIVSVDEYLEMDNDQPDSRDLAEITMDFLVSSAESADLEDSDELIERIEEHGEFEEPLVDILELSFSNQDEMELTGEDIVAHVERELGLKWADEDALDDLDDIDDLPVGAPDEVD